MKKIIFILLIFWVTMISKGQGATDNIEQIATRTFPNIYYFELPKEFSKDSIRKHNQSIMNQLHTFVSKKFTNLKQNSSKVFNDAILIFTDSLGNPILPDLEMLLKLPATQKSNNELTFTFDSPSQPWSQEELDSLNGWLKDFYPMAKNIYGNPLFSNTVNIRKDTTSFTEGYYNLYNNEIVLCRILKTTLCHEMLHAFRDDLLIRLPAYEEGMVRAVEVEIFNQLEKHYHWDEYHSYDYDIYYEALNKPFIGGISGGWPSPSLLLLRYQLSSYVWTKAYLEDTDFFKAFNSMYYSQAINNPLMVDSELDLKNIFQDVKPIIEGMPIEEWYDKQHILKNNAAKGYQIYQRINQYSIDYFYKESQRGEIPQNNEEIEWLVFDFNNALIDSGKSITDSFGKVGINPSIPTGYFGRIKLVANANGLFGNITDTSYRNVGAEEGVFGVLLDTNSGRVTINSLDENIPAISKQVLNGIFSFPSFKELRGRFKIDFIYPDSSIVSHIFTKDASDYFVILSKTPTPIIPPEPPVLIYPFNGATDIDTNLLIRWKKSPGATTYKLQISHNKSFTSLFYELDGIKDTLILVNNLSINTRYYWRVSAANVGGSSAYSSYWMFTTSLRSNVDRIGTNIPLTFSIYQNFPNPINPTTTFKFGLPQESKVTLSIYNILGQQVARIVDGLLTAGYHSVNWDASNFSSGVYIYRIEALPSDGSKPFTQARKMILMK